MRSRLFRARELVGFAALAGRRLFQGHFDYCNFDTYAFIIQHYDPGNPGAFSFSTRRRDSVTQRYGLLPRRPHLYLLIPGAKLSRARER
jgi:hypothetical protein